MSFTHVATTYLGPGRQTPKTVSRRIYECDVCEGLVEAKQLDSHRCPLKNSLDRLRESIAKIDQITRGDDKEQEDRKRQQFTIDLMTRESLIKGINEEMTANVLGRIRPT